LWGGNDNLKEGKISEGEVYKPFDPGSSGACCKRFFQGLQLGEGKRLGVHSLVKKKKFVWGEKGDYAGRANRGPGKRAVALGAERKSEHSFAIPERDGRLLITGEGKHSFFNTGKVKRFTRGGKT